MSEAKRARLYDWWREQTDEETAEYAMSCLTPVPLPDLATKADLFAVKDDVLAVKADVRRLDAKLEADRKALAEQREADRKEREAQREADRKERNEQREADLQRLESKLDDERKEREADRRDAKVQFRWLAGIGLTIVGTLLSTFVI